MERFARQGLARVGAFAAGFVAMKVGLGYSRAMTLAAGMNVTTNVTLVRPLGRGGMGEVWVGHHRTLDTEVAVKFVNSTDKSADPALLERFRREAALAAKIKNPHVVKMLDHGTTETGDYYIVMEMLEGETLGARLRRAGCLAPAELTEVLLQVAAVLDEAHRLGVIHRDIKPDNIFLCRRIVEPFSKLLDFGIAKQQSELGVSDVTTAGAIVGTPEYMSPEQLLSTRTADATADLWSLAVVAYRSLVGRPPFSGATLPSLSMAICQAHYTPPSQLDSLWSATVDAWFARCFAVEVKARYSSASAMVSAFAAALQADFPEVRIPRLSLPPAPPRDSGPSGALALSSEVTTGSRGALVAAPTVALGSGTKSLPGAELPGQVAGGENSAELLRLERRYHWVSMAGFLAATLAVVLAVARLRFPESPEPAPGQRAGVLPSGDPWQHAKKEPLAPGQTVSAPPHSPAAIRTPRPPASALGPDSPASTGSAKVASGPPRWKPRGQRSAAAKRSQKPVPSASRPARANCYFIDENGRTAIDPRCL